MRDAWTTPEAKTGRTRPSIDPSYGVWQFKTRFGGFVEELPGKFTLPVDGLRFGVSEAAHKLLHR